MTVSALHGRVRRLGFALLAMSWPLLSFPHHSISVIDISHPVWVKGSVVRYRAGNPHALLELDVPGADGKSQRWIMEGPFPGRMARIIDLYGGNAEAYLKPGDKVALCGFPPKAAYGLERSYGDPNMDRMHFLHAQVIVMPDGQMRSWGPYGKLDNCVRAADKVEAWLEFLDRDTLAHGLWCQGLRYTKVPTVAPRDFVEDVNRGLKQRCQ